MSDRRVALEVVFDRHAAAELSVVYRILVPEQRRRVCAAAEASSPDEPRDQPRDESLGA